VNSDEENSVVVFTIEYFLIISPPDIQFKFYISGKHETTYLLEETWHVPMAYPIICSFMMQAKGQQYEVVCVISGFRCEVAENCALLGYYAASSSSKSHSLLAA